MHPLTVRVEFVNLEQGWSDTFEKSWRQHTTQLKVTSTTGSSQSSAAKQSEHEMSPTAKKRSTLEGTPRVKAKAKARTKGAVRTMDPELNKKLVAASNVKTSCHQTCSTADRLLAEMSSNSSCSWASAFGKELESKRATLCLTDPVV